MTKHLTTLLLVLMAFTACNNRPTEKDIEAMADQVWFFSLAHPDGFTLDIRTMTEPTEGIAVSYAETQGSHSREQLPKVIRHALDHDGYVGGWLDTTDSLYYYDSTRLFPEDSPEAALQFSRDNGQTAVFILSTGTEITCNR
ncbi:MAG: hypothetical protein J6Y76_03465 [Paludibacteraceae bacterium]|nr:hypothetical protein [Paludibacteraceae bacterium]